MKAALNYAVRKTRIGKMGVVRIAGWKQARVAALDPTLAATGMYGVMGCSGSLRTREIGIRIALGAESSSVELFFCATGLRSC